MKTTRVANIRRWYITNIVCICLAIPALARAVEPTSAPEGAAAKVDRIPPQTKAFTLSTPFVLKGGMDDFLARNDHPVRLFPGVAAFRGFLTASKQSVWPIAEFATPYQPENEGALREALLQHAKQFGADYVVVLKNPAEIREKFPSPVESLVYCAIAYRRVEARLGIEVDPVVAKDGVVKVAGFVKDSQAEANGLRVGDIVKTVQGEEPGSSAMLNNGYWSKALHWKAGDKVMVEVDRGGQRVALEVQLIPAP